MKKSASWNRKTSSSPLSVNISTLRQRNSGRARSALVLGRFRRRGSALRCSPLAVLALVDVFLFQTHALLSVTQGQRSSPAQVLSAFQLARPATRVTVSVIARVRMTFSMLVITQPHLALRSNSVWLLAALRFQVNRRYSTVTSCRRCWCSSSEILFQS